MNMNATIRNSTVIALIAAFALFATLNSHSNGESGRQPPQRWEYFSETANAGTFSPSFLNEHGKEGWELVATPSTKDTMGYVFERPLK
jgi:hypothetical protein